MKVNEFCSLFCPRQYCNESENAKFFMVRFGLVIVFILSALDSYLRFTFTFQQQQQQQISNLDSNYSFRMNIGKFPFASKLMNFCINYLLRVCRVIKNACGQRLMYCYWLFSSFPSSSPGHLHRYFTIFGRPIP